MGWEKRGGRSYYYRKKRMGRRVVSEYVGTGAHAETAAALDRLEREKRQAQKAEQAAEMAIDDIIDEIGTMTDALVNAILVAHGYHTHRGQWRKSRDGEAYSPN